MTRTTERFFVGLLSLAAVALWLTRPTSGQTGAKSGEWRYYGGDAGRQYIVVAVGARGTPSELVALSIPQ